MPERERQRIGQILDKHDRFEAVEVSVKWGVASYYPMRGASNVSLLGVPLTFKIGGEVSIGIELKFIGQPIIISIRFESPVVVRTTYNINYLLKLIWGTILLISVQLQNDNISPSVLHPSIKLRSLYEAQFSF